LAYEEGYCCKIISFFVLGEVKLLPGPLER